MFTEFKQPDPTEFTTKIDNPFMTLRPGTTFVLEKPEDGEMVTVRVTHKTKVVDGVTCVVVHDTERVNGVVIEDTYDWFAQDADGNVWYFGEDTAEYEPGGDGEGDPGGSWEAGVDGAEAGIVMLAEPTVGTKYYQEFYEGEAEDWAEALSHDAVANVRYGDFYEVLKTRDVNPLDPSEERKFYVEGVGFVLATDEEGGREQLSKIMVKGGSGDDELIGYAGGDHMLGRGGDDLAKGLDGNDVLKGNGGQDTLKGGDGFDTLKGGRDDDVLKGGDNGDTFVFWGLSNGRVERDIVRDYDASELDVLRIEGGAASVVSERETGSGWTLGLAGDGDSIHLRGVEDMNGDGHILDELLLVG